MQCDKCFRDNTSCGMGLAYRNGVLPCPSMDDGSANSGHRVEKSPMYEVRIQILSPNREKFFALFEIPARGEEEAKFKVLRLFASETIASGEGVRILEVQKL